MSIDHFEFDGISIPFRPSELADKILDEFSESPDVHSTAVILAEFLNKHGKDGIKAAVDYLSKKDEYKFSSDDLETMSNELAEKQMAESRKNDTVAKVVAVVRQIITKVIVGAMV